MPISLKVLVCGALYALALTAPLNAQAQAELRPVPTPDTSKLKPAAVKEVTDARAKFDKARQQGLIGPPLAQVYAELGAAYARAELDAAAAMAFYDASKITPDDSRWLYLRGVIARSLKQDADARANFEAALEVDKIYPPIRYRLADTLVDAGDMEAARKVLQQAALDYKDQAMPQVMLGQLALKQKRYAEAVTYFNAALKLEPAANALYTSLAEAYAGQGNTQAASAARAKAGNTAPVLADPILASLYREAQPALKGTPLQQAQQLAAAGRINAARAKLGEAFKANPNDIEALALNARIEASMGNSAIAQAVAEQALKVKPDSAVANAARGLVYEFAGDDAHAYEFYQKAVRLDPALADAHLLLGNAEMRRGHYAQASEQYRQLTALQREDASAYAHLAAADSADSRCGEALGAINKALQTQSKNGDLMQVFVRVASTCSAAKPAEHDMALDYAQTLYKEHPTADNSSALALVLATQGKFKEAQQYQAEAIFDAVRNRNSAEAAIYKATMQDYVALKKPDRPWPAQHRYSKSPMLAPPPVVPPAPAPAGKP